jgi:hypothetical protein
VEILGSESSKKRRNFAFSAKGRSQKTLLFYCSKLILVVKVDQNLHSSHMSIESTPFHLFGRRVVLCIGLRSYSMSPTSTPGPEESCPRTGRLSSCPLCLVARSALRGCLVRSPKQTNKQTDQNCWIDAKNSPKNSFKFFSRWCANFCEYPHKPLTHKGLKWLDISCLYFIYS